MPKLLTAQQFFKQFPDDDACLNHLFQVRFGGLSKCPKCLKETKFHRVSKQPAFSCQYCGHHLHPMVGTPFQASHTALQKWFYAVYLFTTTRHGVPAKELQRQLAVTYKTAWRMGHEIRKYMAKVDGDGPLGGVVEIDETLMGGHKKGVGAGFRKDKTVVFGMIERGGQIMTKIVPDVKRATLFPIISANIVKGSTIYSDDLATYRTLPWRGYKHESVDHSSKEYVRGTVHTNSIENLWGQLKRSIRGTHIHVSPKHLQKYLGEFEFRFNLRKAPHLMFDRLLANFGK